MKMRFFLFAGLFLSTAIVAIDFNKLRLPIVHYCGLQARRGNSSFYVASRIYRLQRPLCTDNTDTVRWSVQEEEKLKKEEEQKKEKELRQIKAGRLNSFLFSSPNCTTVCRECAKEEKEATEKKAGCDDK